MSETLARRNRLAEDLVLPVLLFAGLGAMTWAVRGCSGYGGSAGCVFAGVTWGAAWWFIARENGDARPRPYASGWIILALTLGIGFSGARGWMQWPSFFEGHLQTNYAKGEYVPISRAYGFLWLFIAGVPWAGLGACLLAWCGTGSRVGWNGWVGRIGCGISMAWLALALFDALPSVFLPLYSSMAERYHDFEANPNLRRLINDNRAAVMHMGLYLGFLLAEAFRKDWRNVKLILTVGLVNGVGWAICQNWKWALGLWPDLHFNWWRCWESSGGISIGVAYGIAYYLVNQPREDKEPSLSDGCPNLERAGVYLGLLLGLGLSIRSGLKGWANIYLGNEEYWSGVLSMIARPTMLVGAVAIVIWIWRNPLPKDFKGDVFPHAYKLIWLVLIVQNVLAQLVTGPHTEWTEMTFKGYYAMLFLLTAYLIHRFHAMKARIRL